MNITLGAITNNLYINQVKKFNQPQQHYKVANTAYKYNLSSDCFQKSDVSFKGLNKTEKYQGLAKDKDGNSYIRHSTNMFRPDLEWSTFADYLKDRFKDTPKVNTYVYACSDGSEPFSMSIMFQHAFDDYEKFFPIVAKDIVEDVIAQNIKRQNTPAISNLNIDEFTKKALNMSDEDIKPYLKIGMINGEKAVMVNDAVKKPVIFSQANILTDLKSIDRRHPSIIMCRNMWPYIDSKQYKKFAEKLYKRLQKGSIVVLGNYDYTGDKVTPIIVKFSDSLKSAGFVPSTCQVGHLKTSKQLIFEKN